MEDMILDELLKLKLRVSALEDRFNPAPSFGCPYRVENEPKAKKNEDVKEKDDGDFFINVLFEKTE